MPFGLDLLHEDQNQYFINMASIYMIYACYMYS